MMIVTFKINFLMNKNSENLKSKSINMDNLEN